MSVKTYNYYNKRAYVVGDIHGHFDIIKNQIKTYKITDSVIIFAGDIGLGFEKAEHYKQIFPKLNKVMKMQGNILLFVHGNHDDPSYFQEEKINYSNIKSIPDYSVINFYQDWDDEMKESPKFSILCVGGGVSIDRQYRLNAEIASTIEYKYWHPNASKEDIEKHRKRYYWNDEIPFYDIDKLDEITKEGYNIEYVVSHTAPDFCYPYTKKGIESWMQLDENLEKDVDFERNTMTSIYNYLINHKHILTGWYYGHFHSHYESYYDNVKFTLLDCEHHKWDMVEIGYKPMEIMI